LYKWYLLNECVSTTLRYFRVFCLKFFFSENAPECSTAASWNATRHFVPNNDATNYIVKNFKTYGVRACTQHNTNGGGAPQPLQHTFKRKTHAILQVSPFQNFFPRHTSSWINWSWCYSSVLRYGLRYPASTLSLKFAGSYKRLTSTHLFISHEVLVTLRKNEWSSLFIPQCNTSTSNQVTSYTGVLNRTGKIWLAVKIASRLLKQCSPCR